MNITATGAAVTEAPQDTAHGHAQGPLYKLVIGAIDAVSRLGLHEQFVTVGDQLGDRRRCQSDTIFVALDLFWHPNAHYFVSSV
jgi:hypothetical protein